MYGYYGNIFIYEETKRNNQPNDKNTVSWNKILDIILGRDSHLTSQPTQPPSVVNEPHHSSQQDLAVRIVQHLTR